MFTCKMCQFKSSFGQPHSRNESVVYANGDKTLKNHDNLILFPQYRSNDVPKEIVIFSFHNFEYNDMHVQGMEFKRYCSLGFHHVVCIERPKARFKRRTFYVPNLIPIIKYMKRSTFQSIKFNMSNLGRPKN